MIHFCATKQQDEKINTIIINFSRYMQNYKYTREPTEDFSTDVERKINAW